MWSAAASAAAGTVPVPGANFAVDVPVLVALFRFIRETYGLTDRVLATKEYTVPAPAPFVNGVIKFCSTEGVPLLLKQFGGLIALEQSAEFVPRQSLKRNSRDDKQLSPSIGSCAKRPSPSPRRTLAGLTMPPLACRASLCFDVLPARGLGRQSQWNGAHAQAVRRENLKPDLLDGSCDACYDLSVVQP